MPRDKAAQSSIVSWRVSGRSAITCKVGSVLPPIIATRTRSSPSAVTAGSINLAMAFVSVRAGLENHDLPLPDRSRPGPNVLTMSRRSEGDIGLSGESRKRVVA